ncbi:hypothetical protein FRC08_005658 [Ceratobasidium sp. 394]|nr:hypothetical protein FRC08_005658 [Ceratobasidium sp. 394]
MTQTVPLAHLASTKPTAAESSSRKTLSALALAVAKAKRIVVVTGAGISCSSGIPDFRSSDGLYNLVKSRYPDAVLKGRDLFDAALFRDPTSSAVFYTFMAELKTQIDSARPAPVHDFLATLDAKGKLLRSYTQNIDGLEERAGLRTGDVNPAVGGAGGPRPKNVQLHGDIHRVRCTLCSASFACTSEHIDQFRTGTPPDCPECTARSDARTARSARALKCGTLRPAIVLYDEPHPLGDHIGAVQTSDLGKKPDLLIVMGTSLKVHGLRRLVKSFARAVHSSRPSPATSTSHSLLHNSAPSSQASTSLSSHDSIFSSQSSQGTLASSQGSSAVSSQTTLESCSQSGFHLEAERYLGQPRPPPFRRRFQTVPEFGPGSEWQAGTQRLSLGGSFSRAEVKPRRATTIPIPGRDYVVSKDGGMMCGLGDVAEPLSAFASRVSLAPPPAPSQSLLPPTKRYLGAIKSPGTALRPSYWDEGSPRKKGRVSEERDDEEQWQDAKEAATEDEGDVARGPLFSEAKGEEVGNTSVDADVIDLDPDEDDGDSMSLDGAVGHMSLDGPADIDTDMDTDPAPVISRPPISPVQTRAKKRAKEKETAAIKRITKKAPRPRAVGTRTSSRLAALAG